MLEATLLMPLMDVSASMWDTELLVTRGVISEVKLGGCTAFYGLLLCMMLSQVRIQRYEPHEEPSVCDYVSLLSQAGS